MEHETVWFDKAGRELVGDEADRRLAALRERYSRLKREARRRLERLLSETLADSDHETDMDAVLSLGEALAETRTELELIAQRLEEGLSDY